MSSFCMPSLGADMESGRVVQWLVGPGDRVKRGDVVVVVETAKGAIEVEIWQDGVIERLLVEEGEVPVGTPIADVRDKDEAEPPRSQGEVPSAGHVRASPRARRLAQELGVDLRDIDGGGPEGSITVRDVERVAASAGAGPTSVKVPRAVPAAVSRDETARRRQADSAGAMRSAIAQLMSRSKREVPHYYLATQIDMYAALEWLQRYNADRSIERRVLPAALLLKASALAVHDVPELNGLWLEDGFHPSNAVHLGVAVSLRGGGLVAPAIHDADRLELEQLMDALRDLVQRTRAGRLRSSQMADPTITVTSLGDRGVELVQGVIYPPQVALVGFGTIVTRPWVVGDDIIARPIVTATLAADHRASDGHQGGLYLAAVDRSLQQPERLDDPIGTAPPRGVEPTVKGG